MLQQDPHSDATDLRNKTEETCKTAGATAGGSGRARVVTAICFVGLTMEGFALAITGVVAPRLAADFVLSPNELGLFFSAVTVGLAIGAVIGGHASDRFGRPIVLLISLATEGVSSLAMAMSQDYTTLVALRFIGGIALGGALPNLIAIVAEAHPLSRRRSAVSIVYAGGPTGGAIVALSTAYVTNDWRITFVAAGLFALLIAALIRYALKSPLNADAAQVPNTEADAGKSHGATGLFTNISVGARTLGLWIAFGGSSLILWVVMAWLPLLLISKGIDHTNATLGAAIFCGTGIVAGLCAGRTMELIKPRSMAIVVFVLMVASFLMLAKAPATPRIVLPLVVFMGLMVQTAQVIAYVISSNLYAHRARALGVGAAVAAARLGAIAGPAFVAALITSGGDASDVFIGVIPIAAIAGCASIWLLGGHTTGVSEMREPRR